MAWRLINHYVNLLKQWDLFSELLVTRASEINVSRVAKLRSFLARREIVCL
jgi:hypothetical protein